MSLQIAAQHLAKKGRGPDTELVHMTKGEIAGLQSLALAHGGSLTINPHTGLAEAGFLSSILPMLAGAAANFFIPGSGAIAGGLTSALVNPRAGLGGIAMGALGGYGGGSLAGNFMNAGMGALSSQAGAALGAGASEEAIQEAVANKLATTGAVDTLTAGAGQVFNSGPSAMQFAKQNMMGIGALAAPILGGMAQPTLAGTAPAQSSGNIRPFSFTRNANTNDPDNPTVDQYYTAGTPMTAPGPDNYPYQPRQTIRMAEGGTVGMMPQMILGGSGTDSSGMPTYKLNRTIGGTAAEPTVDQYFTLVPPQGTSEVETPEFMRAFSGDAGMGEGFNSGFGGGFGATGGVGGGYGGTAGSGDAGTTGADGGLGDVGGGYGGTSGSGDAATGDGGGGGGDGGDGGFADGGILQAYKRMAAGGMSSLGSYSDGGQLLKGPGNGVSDDIPAVIGKRQPARLANNEFVIPARIVSELGNGSTDAGAKELYKMMARVQKARSKTVGKNQIAVDSKARNLLPA